MFRNHQFVIITQSTNLHELYDQKDFIANINGNNKFAIIVGCGLIALNVHIIKFRSI